MAKKTKMSSSQKVGLGVGVTAAGLAALGGFLLYGSKNAAKNRKTVKSWMLKARAEVLEGLENARHMSREDYEKMIERVMQGYRAAKQTSASEVAALTKEMKAHWKEVERTGKVFAGKVSPKRTAKKGAKKPAKKAARTSKK